MAIGRKAQNMQASGLVSLKLANSIHLASAIREKVTELHTFNTGILKLDGLISGGDGTPMKICKPSEDSPLGPLFDDGGEPKDQE